MAAGKMRDQVALIFKERTQRADGGYDTANYIISTVWANVRPVAAKETEKAARLFGSTTYLVSIWADDKPASLTTDWLLRWETAPGGDADFNIIAIRADTSRAMALELVVTSTGEGSAPITPGQPLVPADEDYHFKWTPEE